MRSVMKKAIDNCKRISDKKEVAKVWVRSFGSNNILLYTQRDERGVKYFHQIKTIRPLEMDISFLASPYELEEILKGKSKEKVWDLHLNNESSYVTDETNLKINIGLFTGKFPIEKLPYQPLNDSEMFRELLGEVIKASSKEVTAVEFGGYEISLKAPVYLKRFNLVEDIPKFIFPIDYINQLARNIICPKSAKNKLAHYFKGNELFLRVESENVKKPEESFKQLFVLTQKESFSPKVKALEEEIIDSFRIKAEELWEYLDRYPAVVSDVYLYDENGSLIISPYDQTDEQIEDTEGVEMHPTYKMSYDGEVKRTKVDRKGLLSLVSGYAGYQDVSIVKYNDGDEDCFAFRIYDKYLYSLVMTKKEPNYMEIQKELDKHLEYEKSLTFLNE